MRESKELARAKWANKRARKSWERGEAIAPYIAHNARALLRRRKAESRETFRALSLSRHV